MGVKKAELYDTELDRFIDDIELKCETLSMCRCGPEDLTRLFFSRPSLPRFGGLLRMNLKLNRARPRNTVPARRAARRGTGSTGAKDASIMARLNKEPTIMTGVPMPIVPRLGKTQSRFLLIVHELGDDAYLTRIERRFLSLFKEEKNIGQLSTIATALAHHGLIRGNPGGSPSGMGRPVTIFEVTDLGYLAIEQTLDYIGARRARTKDDVPHAQTKVQLDPVDPVEQTGTLAVYGRRPRQS